MTTATKIAVDGETLVKEIAIRIDRESGFLSPEPAEYVTDPRGLLRLVEDAGATPEQIDQWIEEARATNAY